LVSLLALMALVFLTQASAATKKPERPYVTTSQGVVSLKFGYSTSCTFTLLTPTTPPPATPQPAGTGSCLHGDGTVSPIPLATVKEGETAMFSLRRHYTTVRLGLGRNSYELGPGKNVTWQVPAAGTYGLSLFLRSADATQYEEAAYSLRLRVVAKKPGRLVPEELASP